MAIAEYDLDCYRGDSFSRDIKIENLDLTTSEIRMQIRDSVDGKKVYANLADGAGLTIAYPLANTTTIAIEMGNEITSKFPAESLVYDLQTDTGGSVLTILRGSFDVTGDVTR